MVDWEWYITCDCHCQGIRINNSMSVLALSTKLFSDILCLFVLHVHAISSLNLDVSALPVYINQTHC